MTFHHVKGVCGGAMTRRAALAGLAGFALSPRLAIATDAPLQMRFLEPPTARDLEGAFGLSNYAPRAIVSVVDGSRIDSPPPARPAPAVAERPAKPAAAAKKSSGSKPAIKPDPTPASWVGVEISFDNASSAVLSTELGFLDALGDLARTRDDFILVISGHANATGMHYVNDRLSRKRAEAVRDFLTKFHRIEEERISLRWMGAREPLPNVSPADPRNRRVQFGAFKR